MLDDSNLFEGLLQDRLFVRLDRRVHVRHPLRDQLGQLLDVHILLIPSPFLVQALVRLTATHRSSGLRVAGMRRSAAPGGLVGLLANCTRMLSSNRRAIHVDAAGCRFDCTMKRFSRSKLEISVIKLCGAGYSSCSRASSVASLDFNSIL